MKNLISKRFLALGVIVSLSLTACQKAETESNPLQSSSKDAEMNIVGSARNTSSIKGLISETAATRMQETYKKNYKGKNYTEYVVFDVDDMEQYIKEIKRSTSLIRFMCILDSMIT